MKDILLKLMFNILKIYMNFIMICLFTGRNETWKNKNKKWIYLNQSEFFIQITNLKKALKVHRKIKFNQKDWLKPYIDMSTELRQKPKNNFKKFFQADE